MYISRWNSHLHKYVYCQTAKTQQWNVIYQALHKFHIHNPNIFLNIVWIFIKKSTAFPKKSESSFSDKTNIIIPEKRLVI